MLTTTSSDCGGGRDYEVSRSWPIMRCEARVAYKAWRSRWSQYHHAVSQHSRLLQLQLRSPLDSRCYLSFQQPHNKRIAMNILFLLVWGLVCAFLIFWLKPAQVEAPQSTSVTPVPTPISTARSNLEGIPVNNFNLDVFKKASQSVTMQKQILINLKIMEYELAKLEHFLKAQGFS